MKSIKSSKIEIPLGWGTYMDCPELQKAMADWYKANPPLNTR